MTKRKLQLATIHDWRLSMDPRKNRHEVSAYCLGAFGIVPQYDLSRGGKRFWELYHLPSGILVSSYPLLREAESARAALIALPENWQRDDLVYYDFVRQGRLSSETLHVIRAALYGPWDKSEY